MHVCTPAQIFGEQILCGSCYDRPDVLDFPTYAGCRFLDTAPDNPVRRLLPCPVSPHKCTPGAARSCTWMFCVAFTRHQQLLHLSGPLSAGRGARFKLS